MNNNELCKGVVIEAVDPLAPSKEAYWIERGKTYDRVIASSSDVIRDGEVSWAEARATEFIRIQRTLMQRLLQRPQEDAIQHPLGFEMEKCSASRNGFLVTSIDGLNATEETTKRVSHQAAFLTPLSANKCFVENAVPVLLHADGISDKPVSIEKSILSIDEAETLYRRAFETLPTVLGKHTDQFTQQEADLIDDLNTFRQKRVRWASIQPSGTLVAKESGKIGDAWIFVVPANHRLMQTQKTMHSMNIDDTGLNPYLSILPHDMTPKWACLGALHELVHLRDYVCGIEPAKGRTRDQYLEGEHRAYSIERALAFAYSNGQLQQALKAIVAQELSKRNFLESIHSLVNERLPSIGKSLDQCIEPNPPRSEGEAGVRLGLYIMLIGFEVAKQLSRGNHEVQKDREKKFIELIYEPSGNLPKQ